MTAHASQQHAYSIRPDPVAVGGVGGSGTRLIAAILGELGFDMGHDINRARDNLAFTLLFKNSALWPLEDHREQIERSLAIFLKTMYFRQPLSEADARHIDELAGADRLNAPRDWLRHRAERLLDSPTDGKIPRYWGWKEPNTHIFLPALVESIPNLKYVHVMRHGLDMAYSSNQTQLKFWGEALTGKAINGGGPEESFRYWCAAHDRVVRTGSDMGERFLLLNFDRFCEDPEPGMKSLMDFLEFEVTGATFGRLLDLVNRPATMGRYRTRTRLSAAPGDLATLRDLGFEY
jgi:hypothetical protein